VLYRLEAGRSGRITLLVQSNQAPVWSALPSHYLADTGGDPENPAVKPVDMFYARIRRGDRLLFRLRANPTRKIETRTGPDGKRRNGRRVELVGDEKQVEWLRRKGDQAGFAVLTVSPTSLLPNARAATEDKVFGRRRARSSGSAVALEHTMVSLRPVLFEGVLEVADEEQFRCAITEGIGPGKAYGCGLLSVCPVREGG